MTHKSARTLKPPKEKPPWPPKVRREIAAMAQAAAAEISPGNPQRGAILKAIERLCRRWKVGLPFDWAHTPRKAKEKQP
jgi:hypothetical protein